MMKPIENKQNSKLILGNEERKKEQQIQLKKKPNIEMHLWITTSVIGVWSNIAIKRAILPLIYNRQC